MIKNKFFIIGFLLFFGSISAFGCGCVDAWAASAGASSIYKNYQILDIQNEQLFKEHLDKLKADLEKMSINSKNSSNEVKFRIDSIVDLKNLNFNVNKEVKIDVVP